MPVQPFSVEDLTVSKRNIQKAIKRLQNEARESDDFQYRAGKNEKVRKLIIIRDELRELIKSI